MPGSFFDTNILLYLASGNRAKAERAEEVVAEGGVISVQVLNEITNVARRKMQLSWAEVREFLHWRKGQPALRSGNIRFLDAPEPALVFTRTQAQQTILVALNLGTRAIELPVPAGMHLQQIAAPGPRAAIWRIKPRVAGRRQPRQPEGRSCDARAPRIRC